jgi:hypothetical protein
MGVGIRLRELWRLRVGVAVSVLLALAAALWSIQQIGLFPPRLQSRSLEMATASTHLIVDMPRSAVLDLRNDTYMLESLTNRTVLLGNVIANGSVRQYIAGRAQVPADTLQIAAPLTPDHPRDRVSPDTERHTTDILKSTDQYRLKIEANPTVPVMDVYSQAPTVKAAEALANAAVDGLRRYLAELAQAQRIPEASQIRLMQLGRAHGSVINEGVNLQVAVLVFILALAASLATVVFLNRVKTGWRTAGLPEQTARA